TSAPTSRARRSTSATGLMVPSTLDWCRLAPACPRCGSTATRLVSEFGATACKALYSCTDCLEPFEHVKEI
ncbi:phenylacetate-CoA oxygenase subunit PaaJ, partial [Nonomuraea sp. NPDC049158]